ncbi:MAG: putative acetyltransferase [Actinomycetota bacterium]
MRYTLKDRLQRSDVGSKVTVRAQAPTGGFVDTVGVLESFTEEHFQVRTKRGELVTIDRALVVASKVIAPRIQS